MLKKDKYLKIKYRKFTYYKYLFKNKLYKVDKIWKKIHNYILSSNIYSKCIGV